MNIWESAKWGQGQRMNTAKKNLHLSLRSDDLVGNYLPEVLILSFLRDLDEWPEDVKTYVNGLPKNWK